MATILGNDPNTLELYNVKAELQQMYQLNQNLVNNLNATLDEFKRLYGLHQSAIALLKNMGEDVSEVEYILQKQSSADAFNFVDANQF